MLCACVDIGSNTIRLLVARAPASHRGGLDVVLELRSYSGLGRRVRREGTIGARAGEQVAEVVAQQVGAARELGAAPVVLVATAAVRHAADPQRLVDAVHRRAGLGLEVLDAAEEARLAFLGATHTLGYAPEGEIAVVDVGGGSAQIGLGTWTGGMRSSLSLPLGSGVLADTHMHSDPPSAAQLRALREHVRDVFAARGEPLVLPPRAQAVAVGGSATSLRRLVGARLERRTLERGLEILASAPAREVARRLALDPERVRLLPAGMIVLEEVATRLGRELEIGRGGLREGVILEQLARAPGSARVPAEHGSRPRRPRSCP